MFTQQHTIMDVVTTCTSSSRSPDSVVKPLSPVPQYDPHKVLWRGPVSMVGLSQFSSTAYPVSGHTDYIAEVVSMMCLDQ